MTNLGDLLVITFYAAIVAGIIAAVVLFNRSRRKRKKQLDRIEVKLNDLTGKMKPACLLLRMVCRFLQSLAISCSRCRFTSGHSRSMIE